MSFLGQFSHTQVSLTEYGACVGAELSSAHVYPSPSLATGYSDLVRDIEFE